MPAILYKRRMGTGTIVPNRQGSRYGAYSPQKGERKAVLVGWFQTRREAERALAAWLAGNVAGCEGSP